MLLNRPRLAGRSRRPRERVSLAFVLFVQPRFPIPRKSQFHKDYLPVGLLKLAAWRRSLGDRVDVAVSGELPEAAPSEVYVTSLFTYWADYVRDAVREVRSKYPGAKIHVGGIYASLAPDHCKSHTGCDTVHVGVHPQAELIAPAYDLVDTDFQIIHGSRGCIRRCPFCGTYEIEPAYETKQSVIGEVVKNHVVFYDNNLLANPHIENLLGEFVDFRLNGRVVDCESQSGIDGRLLLRKPELARIMKSARFKTARIAWDGGVSESRSIAQQLSILRDAGYSRRNLQVFMLYNHELSPEEILEKVELCYEWQVQVADCRYRPLDRFTDGYNPQKRSQADDDYFVHDGWTDSDVRGVRRRVRANNICVRYGIPRDDYSPILERISRTKRAEAASTIGLNGRTHDESGRKAVNAVLLGRSAQVGRRES